MNISDREKLHKLICTSYLPFSMVLVDELFELWCSLLVDHSIENITNAFGRANSVAKFPPVPANVIEFLPDLTGHPSKDVAWQLCPKKESEGGYVTDEIMFARSSCEDAIENGDRMARMAFTELYEQICISARLNKKKAVWWYSEASSGTHENRLRTKLRKALEAALCGRIEVKTAKNTVKNICDELNLNSMQFLNRLEYKNNTAPQMTLISGKTENQSKKT